MAHLRKQIRDDVVTTLTGLSTTGSKVYASRVYPMAAANLPGLCVYAKSEEVETTTITRPRTQVRTLTLSVEGFAVATSGLDNTLDAVSLEMEEALATDPSCSSLAKDTGLKLSRLSTSMRASYCRWTLSKALQRPRWLNPQPVSKTAYRPIP